MTATASGAQVPDYPRVPQNATVVPHTAGVTLTVSDMFKIHTNTGDTDAQVNVMPAAADCAGCVFGFRNCIAFIVTFDPASATEKLYVHGDGVANKHAIIAAVAGHYVEWYSDGVNWILSHDNGLVTKEG